MRARRQCVPLTRRSRFSFFNANHAGEGTPRHRPDVTLDITIEDLVTTHPATSTDADIDTDTDTDIDSDADIDSGTEDGGAVTVDDAVPGHDDSDGVDRDGGGPASSGPGAWFVAHGSTRDGRPLPQWATEAYLCDCVLHRMLHAESGVLDIGRSTRTVPLPMWRAVAARDGGCRHPGCDRHTRYADAHHIRWWRKFGETKLDNLLMLCSYHHHLIHRQDWQIRLLPNADAEFTTPDGRILISKPRGQPTIRAA